MSAERVGLALAATAAATPGVLAYVGIYRRWAPPDGRPLEGMRFDGRSWPLVLAWFAGGTAVVLWVSAVHTVTTALDVLAFVGLAAQVVSLLLLFHVPRVLHPRWYRQDPPRVPSGDGGELAIRGRVRWGLAALVLALVLGAVLQLVDG